MTKTGNGEQIKKKRKRRHIRVTIRDMGMKTWRKVEVGNKRLVGKRTLKKLCSL